MDCCICLDDIDKNYITLNCNHVFHKQCMLNNEYITNKKICPLCRQKYNIDMRDLKTIEYYNTLNIFKNYLNKYYNIPINNLQNIL